jgi:hypothetical protein
MRGTPSFDSRIELPEVGVGGFRALATSGGGGIGRTFAQSFAASGAEVDVT